MFFVKHVLYYWFILPANLLVILIGYVICSLVGHCLTKSISNKLKKLADEIAFKKDGKHIFRVKYDNFSWLLGICERILYTTAIAFGFETFIIYWLVAKVGAAWVYAQNEEHTTLDYNRFMIGNALSIIFGGLGGLIIKYFFLVVG